MKDIYILGFPKSGNTWLSRLISSTLDANQDAIESDKVNSAYNIDTRSSEYIIKKRHWPRKLELLNQENTIYIVRDCRDVYISGFFHNHRFLQNIDPNYPLLRAYISYEIRRLNQSWCGNPITRLRNKLLNAKSMVGDWTNHVDYWINKKELKFVKYESLVNNTEMELSRLLANLNITFSEKMLKSAVIKHSFANEKSNFASIGDTKNKSFLRKGISGEWSSFLSSKELDHIYHKNREMLTQLGYLEYK